MQVVARIERLKGGNRRSAVRHKLRLDATLATSGEKALIHNLSSTGILIETTAELAAADQFEVELPDVGATLATVIWSSDNFFGCQFPQSIPSSAVSAALLRSPFTPATPAPGAADAGHEETAEDADLGDDRYPFGVRLRVILGVSAALWALILWGFGVL